MSSLPKIDITKSVMSRVESGEVKMRPKAYFIAKKVIKLAGLLAISIALLVAIFYTVVIIQNGVFKEYLEFGKQGASIFWSSLPWGAIVISVLLTAVMGLGIYLVQQKKRFVPNMIGVVAAVALVTALVFKISPDPSTNALARAVVGADGNPTKIAGTVEEKNGSTIKVKTSNGEIFIIQIGANTLGDKSFEVGDELLVLGNKQDGKVNAGAIKTTKKTERKTAEVKQEEPTKAEPETKPAEESKPEQKPTATAPVVTAPTAPTPPPVAPLPFDGSIKVTEDPTYIYVTYNLNQAATGKCEAIFSKNPKIKYTGYTHVSTAASKCEMKILKSDLGNIGTWNIEACFYYPYSVLSSKLTKYSTFSFEL